MTVYISQTNPHLRLELDEQQLVTISSLKQLLAYFNKEVSLMGNLSLEQTLQLFQEQHLNNVGKWLQYALKIGHDPQKNLIIDKMFLEKFPLPAPDQPQTDNWQQHFFDLTATKLQTYPRNFVSFDIETTGLNVQIDRVIQISAVAYQDNKLVDHFDTFVDPQRQILPTISDITNITNQDVLGQPVFTAVLPQFIKFIRNQVLIGYNISNFDLPFLYQLAQAQGINFSGFNYIDVLPLTRQAYPNYHKYNLEAMKNNLKIDQILQQKNYLKNDISHNSLNDSLTTAELYLLDQQALAK